jgi:hypothetical protein
MNQLILLSHSLLRWAVVILGLWAVISSLTAMGSGKSYTAGNNKTGLFYMISCDIQLLLGLLLYFGNGWFGKLQQFSQYKSDPYARFFAMEHLSMMLLAWLLVHIGRVMVKKAGSDAAKHRRSLLYYGLSFLLIMVSIPWPFRTALGKGWLPSI